MTAPPADPLDGIRGWLAELDRSLRIRTGIGLFLVATCIGAAGAAIYLALDDDNAGLASKESVIDLRDRVDDLESELRDARDDAADSAAAARSAQTEAREARADLAELASKVNRLESAGGGSAGGSGAEGGGD